MHDGISFELALPRRAARPRNVGMTCCLDNGLSTSLFRDVIESHGHLVDCFKFGWGTSLVTKDLHKKIEILQYHQVSYSLGGSLFEKAHAQGKIEQFRTWCHSLGCRIVEISNGTIEISQDRKLEYIQRFAHDFTVYSEVGYKDPDKSLSLPPSSWVKYINQELAAGAAYVITETRESGTSGVCRSNGEVRFGLIEDILTGVRDCERLIFEAPTKDLQAFFIKRIGPHVNLANIHYSDIVPLETLRLGLKSDTFDMNHDQACDSGAL